MRFLILVALLLVATRSTLSVTTEVGHCWGELLGSGQANAATRIACSTFSDTMSPSQRWAIPHDDTQNLPFSKFEILPWESDWLQGNSLLEFAFSNNNRVDPFGEFSSLNEWHSSPGSKIDASHINFESQQLSQKGENLDCLIDPNPTEILPQTDFLASSTLSDTMSPSQGWAMPHDDTQNLPFPEFEILPWESDCLQGNSLLEFALCNNNCVDPPGPGSNHNTCGSQTSKIVKAPKDKHSGLFELKVLIDAVLASKPAKHTLDFSSAELTLNLCSKFNELFQSSDAMVKMSYRSYHSGSTRPIWGCFVHHCRRNINEWIRKWGTKFTYGDFRSRNCPGLKGKKCGEIHPPFDIEARHQLRKKSKSARVLLPAISEIIEQYNHYVTVRTKSMRRPHPDLTALISKGLRPVNNCWQLHCRGDADEFVRRWGEFLLYSTFRHDCCPGKEGEICQYRNLKV